MNAKEFMGRTVAIDFMLPKDKLQQVTVNSNIEEQEAEWDKEIEEEPIAKEDVNLSDR